MSYVIPLTSEWLLKPTKLLQVLPKLSQVREALVLENFAIFLKNYSLIDPCLRDDLLNQSLQLLESGGAPSDERVHAVNHVIYRVHKLTEEPIPFKLQRKIRRTFLKNPSSIQPTVHFIKFMRYLEKGDHYFLFISDPICKAIGEYVLAAGSKSYVEALKMCSEIYYSLTRQLEPGDFNTLVRIIELSDEEIPAQIHCLFISLICAGLCLEKPNVLEDGSLRSQQDI